MRRVPRFTVNAFRDRAPAPPRDAGQVRAFHRLLPGYEPTPYLELPALAADLGVGQIHLKDESHRFGLNAFKALGACWAIHRLRTEGRPLTTLATATDGNHGRAVAWTARQLGLQARIFMTSHSAPARIEAIRGEGAEVVLVDGTYDDAVRTCAERSATMGWQVVADVGYGDYLEIPAWITDGYATLLEEAAEQRTENGLPEPDVVVVQAGVGGLAAAVVNHVRVRAVQPAIVVVEPVDADPLLESARSPGAVPTPSTGRQRSLMAGLNCGTVSLAAWPILRGGVDLFLTIEDRHAMEAMRRLARPPGADPEIVAGESGAAGLAGLIALLDEVELRQAREAIGLGPASIVMLINTEGATDPDSWQRITGMPSLTHDGRPGPFRA